MERRQRKIHKENIQRLKVRIFFIGIIFTMGFIIGGRNHVDSSNITEKGKEYLLQLEHMDLAAVEAKINEHHKEVQLEAIESGDFKTIYEDTVFMGDSITESLSFNEIVYKNNVISYMGDTVRKAMKHIPTVAGLQPRNLVLLYGMNDVILFEETAEWNSIDKFKEEYKNLIEEIKKNLPNTNIYVQSPLPVTSKAIETNTRLTNENLTRFREAVKEVCEETGVNYVDISMLAKEENGFHEGDGIHLKREFYDKWLGYLRSFMNK